MSVYQVSQIGQGGLFDGEFAAAHNAQACWRMAASLPAAIHPLTTAAGVGCIGNGSGVRPWAKTVFPITETASVRTARDVRLEERGIRRLCMGLASSGCH